MFFWLQLSAAKVQFPHFDFLQPQISREHVTVNKGFFSL